MAAKRIVLNFDGTWNSPGDSGDIGANGTTNVWWLHRAVRPTDKNGVRQESWYQKGVGTRWYNRLTGGTFGVGLSRNVRQGYEQLVDTYKDGDEICIFGFSRGAYTARSLVGMIRNAGLLLPQHKRRITEAEVLYRSRDEGPDSATAVMFRKAYSRGPVPIHVIGLWDTVGALGIPLRSFGWFNRPFYEFHDARLSGIVENAFHALAVDEHRESFDPTLWQPPKARSKQRMEQTWFSGAHANIGGGYEQNRLSEVALLWMAERARQCGLALDTDMLPDPQNEQWREPIVDSYSEFLRGAFSRFSARVLRPLGDVEFGNEKADDSLINRLSNLSDYRPDNEVRPHLTNANSFPGGRLI